MAETKSLNITKLLGASNYEIWKIRITTYMIREGTNTAIMSDINDDKNDKALATINLLIEDGPLLQIQHIKKAYDIWKSLENLYSPKGFTSEFLILREFFDTNLNNTSSMEEYLNKIKQLSDQLKAKDIELPKQVVIAWVLNNLTDNYDGLVSNITQTLWNDIKAYNLEDLFSNLLDESKRLDSRDGQVLYNSSQKGNYKGKKPQKITKGKYCRNCKQTSHNIDNCAFLFPDKAPKGWKLRGIKTDKTNKIPNKLAIKARDDNIDILYSNIPIDSEIVKGGSKSNRGNGGRIEVS